MNGEDFDWDSIEDGSILAIRIESGNDYWDCIVKYIGQCSVHAGTKNPYDNNQNIIVEKYYNWSSLYPSNNVRELRRNSSRFFVSVSTISQVDVLTRPKEVSSIMVDGFEYIKPSWLSF